MKKKTKSTSNNDVFPPKDVEWFIPPEVLKMELADEPEKLKAALSDYQEIQKMLKKKRS